MKSKEKETIYPNLTEEKINAVVEEQIDVLDKNIENEKFKVFPDIGLPLDVLSSFKEDVIFDEYTEEVNQDEERELTDEEKSKILIEQLKRAKVRFTPIKHIGKITVNQFPSSYKENRRRKNKVQRKSRSINRK